MEILHNEAIHNLIAEYKRINMEDLNLGFNIFAITSDLYYRENYHSDVLKAFLDPTSAHGEKNLFLNLFIEMINKKIGKRLIELQDYENAEVIREEGRIDILIRSDKMHCIIVENKMHNASDMYQQLPRYYNKMREEGYTIDAIVYLPLNSDKEIDLSSWTDLQKTEVLPKLHIIPAYCVSGVCLVSDWIEPSLIHTKNIDCISILRQYSKLIKSLTPYNMADNVREKLLSILFEDPNILEQAQTLAEIINQLPDTMATRLRKKIQETLNPAHVKKYPSWTDPSCVIEFKDADPFKTNQIYIFTHANKDCAYQLNLTCLTRDKQYTDVESWFKPSSLSKVMEKNSDASYMCTFAFGEEDLVIELVRELVEMANSK